MRPDPVVKRYLEWYRITRWLNELGVTDEKLRTVSEFMRDRYDSTFHNGCFIQFSETFDEEHLVPADVLVVRDILFREYPDLVDYFGDIHVWYSW